MVPPRSLLPLLAALALAGPALAQTSASEDEAVPTAARKLDAKAAAEAEKLAAAQPAAATTRPMTTQEQIAAFLDTSPAARSYDDGPLGMTGSDEKEPRKIHGSAGVTVGSGGYRSAYVSTLIPIGENATLGLAYGQTDFGKNVVYRPDYDGFGGGYGGGYGYGRETLGLESGLGYGGYGYGSPGRWSRGGKQKNLAVSLAVGSGGERPPEGCAPAFRADGRYVEPLWATQMRGDHDNPCADRR